MLSFLERPVELGADVRVVRPSLLEACAVVVASSALPAVRHQRRAANSVLPPARLAGVAKIQIWHRVTSKH